MLIQQIRLLLLQFAFVSLSQLEVTSFVISPPRAVVYPTRKASITTGRSIASFLSPDNSNNKDEDAELFYYIAQGGSRNKKDVPSSPQKPGVDELLFYRSLSPASSTKSSGGSLPVMKGALAPQDISSFGSAHNHPTRVNNNTGAPRSNAAASTRNTIAEESSVAPSAEGPGGKDRSGLILPIAKGVLEPQDISSLGSAHAHPIRVNNDAAPSNAAARSSNTVAAEPPMQPLKQTDFIAFLSSESDPGRYRYEPSSKTSEGSKQVPKNSEGSIQVSKNSEGRKQVPKRLSAQPQDIFESDYSPYTYPSEVGYNAGAPSGRDRYQARAFQTKYVSPYSYPFQVGNNAAPYSVPSSGRRNHQPPPLEHPYRSEYLPILSDVAGTASVIGSASANNKPVPVDPRLWPDSSKKTVPRQASADDAAAAGRLPTQKKTLPSSTNSGTAASVISKRVSQQKKTEKPFTGNKGNAGTGRVSTQPFTDSDAAATKGRVATQNKIEKPFASNDAVAAGEVSSQTNIRKPSIGSDAAVAAGGIPVQTKTEAPKKKRIGILLMDHGSHNQASNDRLHELARIYQDTMGKDTINQESMVVTAAHMEIASPSIPEGLKVLLDAGVDAIICHPYFLSANGRQVSEDIPEIMEAAKVKLEIDIPLVTTEPVGSQTDVMVLAMHSLVMKGVLTL